MSLPSEHRAKLHSTNQRARYMTLESITPMSNDDLIKLPAVTA